MKILDILCFLIQVCNFKTIIFIAVTEDLVQNYTGGVYYDTTNDTNIEHDISVVGYGHDAESGWDYWIIRNSWGTYWVGYNIFNIDDWGRSRGKLLLESWGTTFLPD